MRKELLRELTELGRQNTVKSAQKFFLLCANEGFSTTFIVKLWNRLAVD